MAIPHSIRRRLVLISGVLPLFFSCAGTGSIEEKNPSVEKSVSVSGAALFLQHCAICHGENGKLGASGAKDLSLSKLDGNQVVQMIKNGKNAMPPMKDLLGSEANIDLVAAHVIKLRK
jgi:mono/diheme cytochrome c family protein